LGAFVERNGACELSEVACELFHGNVTQAFIAAIFADAKIQMQQEAFYGSVSLSYRDAYLAALHHCGKL
jgi:hypothetical protein